MKALALFLLSASARAAETLVPVSPPTDWFGIGVVAIIGALLVAIVGVILYYRRPGLQPGEEAIDKLVGLISRQHSTIATQAAVIKAQTSPMTLPVVLESAAPATGLVYDGITFADAATLAAYKAAKGV